MPGILSVVKRMKIPSLPKNPKYKKPDVKLLKEDMERLGNELANDFADRVKEGYEKNKFNVNNLYFMDSKEAPVNDELIDAIFVDGSIVGVSDTPRTDCEETNKELAVRIEYGRKDKGEMAKPLWRHTFESFSREAKKRVKDFYENPKFYRDEEDTEED